MAGKVTIENFDGTERELETVESFKEVPDNVHEGSGLYQTLKDFLPKEGDDKNNGKDGDKAPEIEKTITAVLAKAEADRTAEDKTLLEANKEIVTKLTTPPPPPKLEEMDSKALVEEVKKNQRLVSERDVKIKDFEKFQTENTQLKAQIEEFKKNKVGEDPTAKAFFELLRKDATAAWSQYKAKLNLPDLGLVQTQFAGGGHSARLKQHLETTVKPEIEKEFGMEKGTFKFNAEEAEADPTSASARYLELKRHKEDELRGEVINQETKEKQIVEAVKSQQAADLKWYTEKYLGGDQTKAQELMKEFEAKALEVIAGKAKPEEHPFSLRNVLRGFKHEQLVQEIVTKTVGDIKQQYAALGAFLPGDTKDNITNLKEIKSGEKPKDGGGQAFKIEKSEFSPMLSGVEEIVNTQTKKR